MIKFYKDQGCINEIALFLGLHNYLSTDGTRKAFIKDVNMPTPKKMIVVKSNTDYEVTNNLEFYENTLTNNIENNTGYIYSDGNLLFETQNLDSKSEDVLDRTLKQKIYIRFYGCNYTNVVLKGEINGNQYDISTHDLSFALDHFGIEGTYFKADENGMTIGSVSDGTILPVWIKYTIPKVNIFRYGRFFSLGIYIDTDVQY